MSYTRNNSMNYSIFLGNVKGVWEIFLRGFSPSPIRGNYGGRWGVLTVLLALRYRQLVTAGIIRVAGVALDPVQVDGVVFVQLQEARP